MGETPAANEADRQSSGVVPTNGLAGSSHGLKSGGWLTITDARHQRNEPGRSNGQGSKQMAQPGIPPRSGDGKRIVYDISEQRVWLITRKNEVARTYLVSGSKDEDILDPGHYAVYSKSRDAVSFNSKETMNYMVRFATGERSAIGFHDIPAFQDGTLVQSRRELGTPKSAGCIRQWISDAKALWEFSHINTPVVVTP